MKKYIVILLMILAFVVSACNDTTIPSTQSKENDKAETAVNSEEAATGTNYEKISVYLENECKKVYSPYYELLDFQISDYQEEVVDGKVEATFLYKVIHKNYDKDPDTVGYIKEAKERGDKHYQTLYDEYLQPQEMNFQFKAVITENDVITLYSNISPKGIEWEEVEMSDFIIKK